MSFLSLGERTAAAARRRERRTRWAAGAESDAVDQPVRLRAQIRTPRGRQGAPCWDASGELADDAAHPGEQVRAGPQNRRSGQGESGQERNGVAVHGPGETVHAVPAEPSLPVDDRLEHDKRERACGEKQPGASGHSTDRDARGGGHGSRLEPLPLTDRKRGEPDDGRGRQDGKGDGYRGDRPGRGAACHSREVAAVGRRDPAAARMRASVRRG